MRRRDFFKRFGTVAVAAVAAPLVAKEILEMVKEPHDTEWEEVKIEKPLRYVDPRRSSSYSNEWSSIYDVDFDPQVWQEWHKKYGKGFATLDWRNIPK